MNSYNTNKLIHIDYYFQEVIRACDQTTEIGFEEHNVIDEYLLKINNILLHASKDKQLVPVLDDRVAEEIKDLLAKIAYKINTIKKTEIDSVKHALELSYKKFNGIPTTKEIENGDELHNINCYEYLRNFSVIDIQDFDLTLEENKTLAIVFKVMKYKYSLAYPYGDLYTKFQLALEEKANSGLRQHPFIKSLIYSAYNNHNIALNRSYNSVKDTLRNHNQTSSACEHAVRQKLAVIGRKQINTITGRDIDSYATKITDKIVIDDVKPQTKTSIQSFRRYAYQNESYPREMRIGTQAIFIKSNPAIFSPFIALLANEKELDNRKCLHIYFNLLPIDRQSPTKNPVNWISIPCRNTFAEVQFSRELHKIDEAKYGIAVITLPSGQGLLAQSSESKSYQAAFNEMLDVACGRSLLSIQDFRLSKLVKEWLYQDKKFTEETKMRELLDKSFKLFGFKKGDELSGLDQQMVYFHFIKYEIPRFMIKTLNPNSYNFTCWDGMDRGGIESAYYNLLQSIEAGIPLSLEEFEYALHGATIMIKERSMNEQIKLLWSVINFHIVKDIYPMPEWIKNWCKDNSLSNVNIQTSKQDNQLEIKNGFSIIEQECITDFVLNNAPGVKLSADVQNDIKVIDENTINRNESEKSAIQNFLTNMALASGVENECWQQKDNINQFFHNTLAYFIFIYLNPNMSVLSQINELMYSIDMGYIDDVVTQLKFHKQHLVNRLNNPNIQFVVTNAANANNMGGAVTYKRGTVEEALCRKSDLFLNMLFFHANGQYQKNILRELLNVFQHMLQTGKLPIDSKENSSLHAKKWISLIYKTSSEGYKANGEHITFFIDPKNLPGLMELNQSSAELQEKFINSLKLALVIDVVSQDLRTQTKALKFFGVQDDEDNVSFHENIQSIITKMNNRFGNDEYTLAIVPLGCGAFGNKIEDFWTALERNIPALTNSANVSLVIREDNCLQLIKLSNPVSDQLEYMISLATMMKLWTKSCEEMNLYHIQLMMNVFSKQIEDYPQDKIHQFCSREIKRAYLLKLNKQITEQTFHLWMNFAEVLMGKTFKIYQTLLNTVEVAINNYDIHTGGIGYFNNLLNGENFHLDRLRKFHKKLYTNANFTSETMYKYLFEINAIINDKRKYLEDKKTPSLLDKSFNKLAEGVEQFEKELKAVSRLLYQASMTQRFFARVMDIELPYEVTSRIANNLIEMKR